MHYVLHFVFAAYIQEVGRAGRDGLDSSAVMYFNRADIAPNVTGMTETMRKYVNLDTCRRQYICEQFGFDMETEIIQYHDCCDICERNCSCEACFFRKEFDTELEEPSNANSSTPLCNDLNKEQVVYGSISSYFEMENSVLEIPNACVTSGLTTGLAKTISEDYISYSSVDLVLQNQPWISVQVAENISLMVTEIINNI